MECLAGTDEDSSTDEMASISSESPEEPTGKGNDGPDHNGSSPTESVTNESSHWWRNDLRCSVVSTNSAFPVLNRPTEIE